MQKDRRTIMYSLIGLLSILYIIFSGPLFILNIPFLFMQFFGFLLIGWALLSRKVNAQHHADKLPKGSFFVTKGVYEIIRHPVYAGLLLIMIGFVEEDISLWRGFAVLLLIIVVLIQIARDEQELENHVKEYTTYKTKTHKLVPYFY
jgi:protein-S-isoprenylcysteine O-methyltransferase Ste14